MLKYKLKRMPKKKLIIWTTMILLFFISMGSIVGYYAAGNVFSGVTIEGNVVIVDDLVADWNYYMGLNYTEITDKDTLPGINSTNNAALSSGKYSQSSLVAVQINYDGSDINNSDLKGYVSYKEDQSMYVYRKYVPIVDGKITIELIDNPFTMRPTGRAFNGWVCDDTQDTGADCNSLTFSYDNDKYLRYVTLDAPTEVDENGFKKVIINLKTSWSGARIVSNFDDINDVFQYKGMAPVGEPVVTQTPIYEYIISSFKNNVTYYEYTTIGFQERYRNHNCKNGGNDRCYQSQCACYIVTEDDTYNENKVYYVNYGNTTYANNYTEAGIDDFNSIKTDNIIGYEDEYSYEARFDNGTNLVGYYYLTDYDSNKAELYYSEAGVQCSLSGANCGNQAYKLIQSNDDESIKIWTINEVEDADGNVTQVVQNDSSKYFYFSSRDTNIFDLSGSTASFDIEDFDNYSYPMTVTGNHDGDYSGETITSGSLSIQEDMVLENLQFNGVDINTTINNVSFGTTDAAIANYHNFKISRTVTAGANNMVFRGVRGGDSDGKSSDKSGKIIVEAGYYNYLQSQSNSDYNDESVILQAGNDYDRVKKDNNNLRVYFQMIASTTGWHDSESINPTSLLVVKSGTIGSSILLSNNSATSVSSNYYYMVGIYVGARNGGSSNSLRSLKIEGGHIFSINGGPCIESYYLGNVISIYMTGGVVDNIVGGAGSSPTNGNRLISITGGQVTNSVAGGSNSYEGSANEGELAGNTLVYVGGNAVIGGGPTVTESASVNTLMGIDIPGSVFGAGLGYDSRYVNGVVNNSHVIIDGKAKIKGSVFGGGNFGATGVEIEVDRVSYNNNSTNATVDILGGTIEGSVFGSANNNGAGYNNGSTDYDDIDGVTYTVLADMYWIRGRVNSGSDIPAGSHLADGSIASSATECTDTTPGYVDGGRRNRYCYYYTAQDAGTTYNSNTTYYDFNSNSKTFYETTPNVNSWTEDFVATEVDFYHDITINMHGGTVLNSVYGGSNVSGTSYADVTINLYKGTVSESVSGVYGGGKGQDTIVGGTTLINTIPTSDSDLNINDIYGGSELGQVNINGHTDININGGTINTVYGGGKGDAASSLSPKTYGTIDVSVTSGNINKVFGGNNEYGHITTKMSVSVSGGKINSVYGGANGDGASVTDTNVKISGGRIVEYVYGGGALARTDGTSSVTITGGDFAYFTSDGIVDTTITPALIFGGGEAISVNKSYVYIEDGANVYSVYGGSNFRGVVGETNVYNNGGNVLCNTYGGGKNADVDVSNNYLNGTTYSYTLDAAKGEDSYSNSCGNAFGGGANASVGEANILLNGSSLINVYGGSDQAGTVTNSSVIIKKGNVENVFGGNNAGGDTVDSYVLVDLSAEVTDSSGKTVATGTASNNELTVNNVFGGSNGKEASISDSTVTEIKSGTITNDVFGGGNQAKVIYSTTVNMYDGQVRHLYGGGNRAFIGDAIVSESGALIERVSYGYTYLNVVGGEITGNVYGSGNASFVNGNTYLKIGNDAYSTLGITDETLYTNLHIGGSVFAGSETNTDKSTTYDESYEGVTGEPGFGKGLIEIDGSSYVDESTNRGTLLIDGSIYGSGNNSKVLHGSTIYIDNLGTEEHPLIITTIQRANNVYITDSYLELNGDRDRADPDSYKYSLIRLEAIYLLGSSKDKGTHLYLRKGTSFLKAHYSGAMVTTTNADNEEVISFSPQTVGEVDGVLKPDVSNNKIFMYKRIIYSVSASSTPSYDADTTNPGPVTGMTYLGMYSSDLNSGEYQKGIYDDSYDQGGTYNSSLTGSFEDSDYTFVYGLHADDPDMNDQEEADYQVVNNGFYTHVQGVDTAEDGTETKNNTITVEYVGVTPLDTTYFKWVIGEEPAEIIVDLIADKYSESGTVNALITLDELKETLEDGTKQEWRDAVLTITGVETDEFGAVKGVDATENIKGYLVDKSQVPTINTNDVNVDGGDGIIDSNQYFALSMGTTTTGWLDNYKTNFYDEEFVVGDDFCDNEAPGGCTGDEVYLYDSTTKQRSLSFWLYHSKNLDFQYILQNENSTDVNMLIPMGKVVIHADVYNPHANQSTTEGIQKVIITVNISLSDGELDKYGGIIAPGKQYEVFQGKSTTIPTDGAFSIYQSLSLDLQGTMAGSATNEPWSVDKLYNRAHDSVKVLDAYGVEQTVSWSEAYRYLNSDIIFPVGTKITMLDLKNNEQYYYEVTEENRQEMIDKHSGTNNEYKYMLEDFVKMGSISTENLYDDDMNEGDSTKYYYKKVGSDGKVISEMAVEEFIFMVDFSSVDAANTSVLAGQHYLFLELGRKENNLNDTVISTNGMPKEEMVYTVVSDVNSSVSTTGGYVQDDGSLSTSTSIYVGESATLELNTKLSQQDSTGKNLVGVSDTVFDEYKLGAKITIQRARKDSNGEYIYVDGELDYETLTTDLFGTVMTINNVDYYPQTDGSTRIELAGRITDVKSLINIDFSNADLGHNQYQLIVETFVSYDGLYYGDFTPTYNVFPLTMLNNQYGLDVNAETSSQITHDVNTGEDQDGSRDIHYLISSVNSVEKPILRVSLERREYDVKSPYGTTYKKVDLANLAEGLKFGETSISLEDSCYTKGTDGVCYYYTLGTVSNGSTTTMYDVYLTLKNGPNATDLQDKANAKWKSGTYRVVFTLFDGDTEVGSVYEYLVIRSLDIDEIIIEGSGN